MHLLVLGLDHRTAPLELRERCVWSGAELPAALAELRGGDVVEAALLCTCNRTEVYAAALDPGAAVTRLTATLAARAGVAQADLRPRLYCRIGAEETARHLCRVSCGLEALVIGETQVLAQVKEAYQASAEAGTVGKLLHGLFHHALACSKRVHSETRLSRAPVSVGAAAVDFARRELGALRERSAVLLGAGETAEIVGRRLREAGVGRIDVVNRTEGRAHSLAAEIGGAGWAGRDLGTLLPDADILIASTASSTPVVTRAMIERVLARRGGRPLLVLDIAVPRDVEPSVGDLPSVRLCNIDDLEEVAAAGRADRAAEVAEAEALVDAEAGRFEQWLRSLDVVPLLAALSGRLEEIGRREVERALRRLPDLSPRDRALVEQLGHGIVHKVLDEPLRRVKDLAGTPAGHQAVSALAYAFGLDLPVVVGLPGGVARDSSPGA